MRVIALVLLLVLQTHVFANSAGLWTRIKHSEVTSKLNAVFSVTKFDLGRKVVLLGTTIALACGVMSCGDPTDFGNVADLLREEVGAGDLEANVIIRIGLSYDSSLSHSALAGAELAIAQVNAVNQDNGIQLELVARDSMGDSALSYQLMSELITEQMVHAIVGPSRHALLVAEIAHRHKVPMITTLVTNSKVTTSGNYIFMSAFTDDFQGQAMAKFARDELEAGTAAVITQGRNAYSRVLSKNFIENFEAEGDSEVVVHEQYLAGDSNFAAQLTAVTKATPKVEVVFVPGFVPEVALIVKQGKAMGIDAIFIGADGWGAKGLLDAGGDALEGTYFLDHISTDGLDSQLHTETLQFIADYSAANDGEIPTARAALSYDAVRIVAEAIARGGSLNGTAIRDEIAATADYSGATSLVRLTDDRHAIKPAVVQTIKDGKIVFYQTITPELED